jgi:hypothetical protein
MNVAIIWDIAPCGPYVNRCFEGTYHLHLHGPKSAEQETNVWQVANPTTVGQFRKSKSSGSCLGPLCHPNLGTALIRRASGRSLGNL